MIKVGIIDQNLQCRSRIKSLLELQHNQHFKVTLDVGTTEEIRTAKSAAGPDVILLDISSHGTTAIPAVYRCFPGTHIIVYTDVKDQNSVLESVRVGAMGYLLKETSITDVAASIVVTYEGGSVFSPSVSRLVVKQIQQSLDYQANLSLRERQIVDGLRNGLSYKLIGYKYGISLDTVRQYIKRTYKKLNINSKGELLAHYRS